MKKESTNGIYTDRRVGNLVLYVGTLQGYSNVIAEIIEIIPTTDGEGAYSLKVMNSTNESQQIFGYNKDVRDIKLNTVLLEKIGFQKRGSVEAYEYWKAEVYINMINTHTIEHADDYLVDPEFQGWLVVEKTIENPVHADQIESNTVPIPTLHALQNYMLDRHRIGLDVDRLTVRNQ